MHAQEPATHQIALLVQGHPEVEQALRRLLEPRGWEIALGAGQFFGVRTSRSATLISSLPGNGPLARKTLLCCAGCGVYTRTRG